jgi:hypothetical protein
MVSFEDFFKITLIYWFLILKEIRRADTLFSDIQEEYILYFYKFKEIIRFKLSLQEFK